MPTIAELESQVGEPAPNRGMMVDALEAQLAPTLASTGPTPIAALTPSTPAQKAVFETRRPAPAGYTPAPQPMPLLDPVSKVALGTVTAVGQGVTALKSLRDQTPFAAERKAAGMDTIGDIIDIAHAGLAVLPPVMGFSLANQYADEAAQAKNPYIRGAGQGVKELLDMPGTAVDALNMAMGGKPPPPPEAYDDPKLQRIAAMNQKLYGVTKDLAFLMAFHGIDLAKQGVMPKALDTEIGAGNADQPPAGPKLGPPKPPTPAPNQAARRAALEVPATRNAPAMSRDVMRANVPSGTIPDLVKLEEAANLPAADRSPQQIVDVRTGAPIVAPDATLGELQATAKAYQSAPSTGNDMVARIRLAVGQAIEQKQGAGTRAAQELAGLQPPRPPEQAGGVQTPQNNPPIQPTIGSLFEKAVQDHVDARLKAAGVKIPEPPAMSGAQDKPSTATGASAPQKSGSPPVVDPATWVPNEVRRSKTSATEPEPAKVPAPGQPAEASAAPAVSAASPKIEPSADRARILEESKGDIHPFESVGDFAQAYMGDTLRVPEGWRVKDKVPSKYGSHYWYVEDPEGERWKLSVRDHQKSDMREREFGPTDISVYVKDANDPEQFAAGMDKLEERLQRAHENRKPADVQSSGQRASESNKASEIQKSSPATEQAREAGERIPQPPLPVKPANARQGTAISPTPEPPAAPTPGPTTQKPTPRRYDITASGQRDILDQLEADGVKLNLSLTKENVRAHDPKTIVELRQRGPLHKLVTTKGGQSLDEVATSYGMTEDELLDHLDKSTKARAKGSSVNQLEKQLEPTGKEKAFQQASQSPAKSRVPISAQDLTVGTRFELQGERLKVTAIDHDGNVTVEDGRKFGKQQLAADQTLHIDQGSLSLKQHQPSFEAPPEEARPEAVHQPWEMDDSKLATWVKSNLSEYESEGFRVTDKRQTKKFLIEDPAGAREALKIREAYGGLEKSAKEGGGKLAALEGDYYAVKQYGSARQFFDAVQRQIETAIAKAKAVLENKASTKSQKWLAEQHIPQEQSHMQEVLKAKARLDEIEQPARPALTLESPTDAQLLSEKEKADQAAKIEEGQTARLTAAPLDTTGDLLDPSKADNPLFAAKQTGKNIGRILKGKGESGASMLPLELARKTKEVAEEIRDATTIDAVPKLTRAGVYEEAVAHASARQSVQHTVRDLLAKVFPDEYHDTPAMQKTIEAINKDNILGGYDDLVKERAAILAQTPTTNVSDLTARIKDIENAHNLPQLDAEVRTAAADPAIAANVARWKKFVNPEMDTLFNEMKRVNPQTPRDSRGRHLDARINLLPENRAAELATFTDLDKPLPDIVTSNYRNPNVKRDPFARTAKLTGKYSSDPNLVLINSLAGRWNEVTKLRLIDAITKKGAGVELEYGDPVPQHIQGRPVARLAIRVPETGPNGKTQMVERSLYVRDDIAAELRNVLNTDMRPKSNPLSRALTTVQLLQVADATAHIKNGLSILASAPGTKSVYTDAIRRLPIIGSTEAVRNVVSVSREIAADTPEIRAEIAKMAKAGMIRPDYPLQGIQKITRGQQVIHMVDTAGRIIMNRNFDNLVERGDVVATPQNRSKFVQQFGEYNRRLMGESMRWMRDKGLSPFVVAGRNFNRQGRRLLTGNPGVEASSAGAAAKMRAVNIIAGLTAAAVLPAMLNVATTGSMAGRAGTPIGAWDLGKEEKNGRHTVIDLLQIMGIRRGLKGTGLGALIEGERQGQTANDIAGHAISDVVQAGSHAWLGPAPGFVFQTLTGKRLDLRGGPQPAGPQKVGGGKQYAENARVALKNQNPLIYGAVAPLLGDKTDTPLVGMVKGGIRSPMSALGVQQLNSPAEEKARQLARSDSYTPEQTERFTERRTLADLYTTDRAKATATMNADLKSGKLTQADVRAIKGDLRYSKSDPIVQRAARLTAPDAIEVYGLATPKERAGLAPMVKQKIWASSTLTLPQKRALQAKLDALNKAKP